MFEIDKIIARYREYKYKKLNKVTGKYNSAKAGVRQGKK